MKNLKVYFGLLLPLIFLFSSNVFGCSCAAKSTVLESFESSDLVIIAKAVSVEMKEEAKGLDFEAAVKKTGYDLSHEYVKSTKMRVEKVYKGNVKIGDELLFGQGGGADCIWTFGIKSVGKSFLFYLGQPITNHPFFEDKKMSSKPAYFPVTCGRSQTIVGYETDDLKYLNKMDKVKGKTRISGDFNCWYRPCPNFSNVKIKIIGKNKIYETKTDKYGTYEIYDLPAGKYLIKPEIQKGWKVDLSMLEYSPAFRRNEYIFYAEKPDFSKGIPLKLEIGKHNGIDFYFEVDSSIRGKVLSPTGIPMKGVCVRAVSTNLKEGDYRGRSDCTNEEGVFLISEIPPNKYILVVNDDGKISAKEPFRTLFYGNTAKYSEAVPIAVSLGDHLDDFVIQVPKTEQLVTVSGKLIYNNGVPVADEYLKFETEKKDKTIDGEQSVRTDREGNFSFKILKNLKGTLLGNIYVYKSKFKNCPQFFDKIKKNLKGRDSGDLKTPKIQIDATKNISDLIVKFDFAGCKRK